MGRRRHYRIPIVLVAAFLIAHLGCGGGGGSGGVSFTNAVLNGDYALARMGVNTVGGTTCGGLADGDTSLYTHLKNLTADGQGSFAQAANSAFTNESCATFGAGPAAPGATSYGVWPRGDGVFDGTSGRLVDASGALVIGASVGTAGRHEILLLSVAQASGFSNASLNSSYGFAGLTLRAVQGVAANITRAAAVAARIDFRGDGTFGFNLAAANIQDVGFPPPPCGGCGGTYSVQPDGRMTMTMVDPNYGFDYSGRITAGGGLILLTDQANVGTHSLAALVPSVGGFSAAGLVGAFQVVNLRLRTTAGPTMPDRWALSGRMEITGPGTGIFTGLLGSHRGHGTGIVYPTGVVNLSFRQNLSGTITVDPDGRVSIDGGRYVGYLRTGSDAFVSIGGNDPAVQEIFMGFK